MSSLSFREPLPRNYRDKIGWINPLKIASLFGGGAVYEGIKRENGSDPRLLLIYLTASEQ